MTADPGQTCAFCMHVHEEPGYCGQTETFDEEIGPETCKCDGKGFEAVVPG